ncbi:uncharacterized protein C15orf39 homolog isoform X2 [Alosa sapidissima]|nr:uncharacterized protein C15orf39 homolog isoform X2 [Alosa sapidissima]XP_041951019.1 uncharacterized protein C15orf39 homolog isoform X2 [Alosa sapidissima]
MYKTKIPAKKRVRVPTQKMKELQNSPPTNEQPGCFAFVRWEDGYTGKVFTGSDILARDEAPVQLQDLRSGDPVLAKWSDGKFYRAIVEYISREDQANPPKGRTTPQGFLSLLKGDEPSDSTSGSDTIIVDRSQLSEHGEEIPALNPSSDGGHATGCNTAGPPPYGSTKGGTIVPSPYGGNTVSPSPYDLNNSGPPPYGSNTPNPSPYGFNTSGPPPYGSNTPNPSPYGLNISGPPPYGSDTPNPSPSGLNTSGPPPYGSNTPSPSPYGLNTSGPPPYGSNTPSPSPYGLNTSGPPPYGSNAPSPSPSDLNTSGPSPDRGHAAHLAPNRRDACNSSDEGNIPGQQEENAWTPCDRCKGEVEKILHEKRRINEVISRIDPGQVRELQTLLELIGERHHDGATSTLGQQELFPGSGILISSFRLAALHQASKPNSMRLFHALFDHFFTLEECKNAVPFGRPGNNPSGRGKRVLDRKKVDGILTYVLRCGTLPGWDEIEEAKLKKAFVNKCRARANSKA